MAKYPRPHEDITNYDSQIMLAVQALSRGEADPSQQKLALEWIVHKAANLYNTHYYPDNDRDTYFALGKAFVGERIRSLLNGDPVALAAKEAQS